MNSFLNVDSVAFVIGGTEIYWYGIIMCLAIVVAIVVATIYCKAKKYDTEMPINIAFVILPSGILCARLFSVIFEKDLTLADYFNFRTGGLSIIGAVIGGAIGLTIYVLIKKPKNPLVFFDTLAVVLILAQAIGRWGNFCNGEVYGQVIEEGSFFARFPFAVEVDGLHYQALFLYESVLNLIGFIVLTIIYMGKYKHGTTTGCYLIYYGIVRTILENFRQDTFVLKLGNLPVSMICSILMIVAGIVLLVYINTKKTKVNNEQKKYRS